MFGSHNLKNNVFRLWRSSPEDIKEKYPFERTSFFSYKTNYEVDHIIALINGGDMWDEKNLRVLCTECHKKKTQQDLVTARKKEKDASQLEKEMHESFKEVGKYF